MEEKNRTEHLRVVEQRRVSAEELIRKLEEELAQAQEQMNNEVCNYNLTVCVSVVSTPLLFCYSLS